MFKTCMTYAQQCFNGYVSIFSLPLYTYYSIWSFKISNNNYKLPPIFLQGCSRLLKEDYLQLYHQPKMTMATFFMLEMSKNQLFSCKGVFLWVNHRTFFQKSTVKIESNMKKFAPMMISVLLLSKHSFVNAAFCKPIILKFHPEIFLVFIYLISILSISLNIFIDPNYFGDKYFINYYFWQLNYCLGNYFHDFKRLKQQFSLCYSCGSLSFIFFILIAQTLLITLDSFKTLASDILKKCIINLCNINLI